MRNAKPPRLPLASSQKDLSLDLRNIGTNINAIARKANNNLARDYTADLRQILADLSGIKNAITDKLLNDGWKD